MTALTVISCDGAWDGGRMPCRGALPTIAATAGHARVTAMRAGWRVSPDDGDLCPAHARRAQDCPQPVEGDRVGGRRP